jgi:hypothetical protein
MTLAEIMAMSGRPDEATELLAGLPSGSSRQRCRQEVDLALILAFGLNRSKDAAERLEVLLDDLDDRDWAYVAGQIPLLWLLGGEIDRALRAAEALLADERASESDRLSAELVLIPALNLVGRPVSALERAADVVRRAADHPAYNEYMVGQLETAVPTGHRYVGDLDRAEETALETYDRVTRQGADMLRGVYALRLGQIALWRGALVRAEQYFLEAVSALEGDTLTRACAVDHVRYTRALTLRPDMPSARSRPEGSTSWSTGSSRPRWRRRRATSPTPGHWPWRRPAVRSPPGTSPTPSSPSTRPPATARRRPRPSWPARCHRSRDGCCRPSWPPWRRWPGVTTPRWKRPAAGWRTWAACCTRPS